MAWASAGSCWAVNNPDPAGQPGRQVPADPFRFFVQPFKGLRDLVGQGPDKGHRQDQLHGRLGPLGPLVFSQISSSMRRRALSLWPYAGELSRGSCGFQDASKSGPDRSTSRSRLAGLWVTFNAERFDQGAPWGAARKQVQPPVHSFRLAEVRCAFGHGKLGGRQHVAPACEQLLQMGRQRV